MFDKHSRLRALFDWRIWVPRVGVALLGLGLGVAVASLIGRLGPMGHGIPSPHITQDYLVALIWALGFGVFLTSLPVSNQERRDLLIFWVIRCGVTLFAMLFYENFYGLDAFGYYEVALHRSFSFSATGFGNGTDNTEALSWLMNHFLPIFDSYHAIKVVYSFIGFAGCYMIYKGFSLFTGGPNRNLFFLVFLFPTVLFWSSILGKDPVILCGIAMHVFGTIYFTKTGKPIFLIPMAAGVLLAALFRSWYLPILVLPLATLGIHGIQRPALKLAFLALIGGAAMLSVQKFATQFRLENMSDLVSRTQSLSHSWAMGGSALEAPEFTSLGSMLKFAPKGMFTALFRPLPGEIMNPFGLLAGFENLFLLAFIVYKFRIIRRNREKLREPLVVWAITLVLVWSFIYSFISFQNLGAATRFKLQILPVLLCLVFYLSKEGKPSDVRNNRSG